MTSSTNEKGQARADRAVRFIQNLTHTKGKWAGVPFILEPWQEIIIRNIFGRLNPDGNRTIRTTYVELPRKNGKSELAAAIALYLLFADGEMGAEVYSAAGDKDQAALVFNVAAQMVRQSRALNKRSKIVDSQKRIIFHKTASFYRAISAEAATKHGYNASGILFDELHVQPNRDLWDVLETSKGAREQPLNFAITTAGYDKHSICWEQHEYGEKILKGIIEDPTFYPVIYSAEEKDDWTDEKTWHKVNPALKTFRNIEEMRAACHKAKEIPALENTFRRLYLNQWTKQQTRWLPIDKWDLCDFGKIDRTTLTGRRCYAGLDLASTTDIAALVLVFPPEKEDQPYMILPYFWVPEENMAERAKKDRVPYDVWTRAGLIKATPGNVIDYKFIFKTIDQAAMQFDLVELAFDRWGATKIVQELQEQGMEVVQFGQGFASMSGPTKELLNMVLSTQLDHGGNPVLRWMADNMVVRQDPAGNVKPDKGKSTEKIDGMVALIMALDRAIANGDTNSIYSERGVIVL